MYGGSLAHWKEDSEKTDFVRCKASGRSVSIFRAWLLKGQVPAKVFIFLSSVCAPDCGDTPTLLPSHPTSPHPGSHSTPAVIGTAHVLPELPMKLEINSICGFCLFLNLTSTLTPRATKVWRLLRKSTVPSLRPQSAHLPPPGLHSRGQLSPCVQTHTHGCDPCP